MKLVKAKCPNCGGELDVNAEAECAVCKFCGSTFIVEKAINNYNTNVSSNVTNINAEKVVVNGYDEKNEIDKARRLIGKDDNLAAQTYQRIFENNPDNYEAQYLRIFYNHELSVKECATARDAFFREVVARKDEEIKPFLRKAFTLEYLTDFETNYVACASINYYDEEVIPNGSADIMLFLYPKDDVIKALKDKVGFYQSCLKEYDNSQYKIAMAKLEDIILTIDPTYQRVTFYTTKKTGGCYVATCVYGSYDCPQVWILRRYRDYYLDEHWWGRLFIKVYYAISPKIVKVFGKTKWFNKINRTILNRKINKLFKKGYEDTPYIDKY